MGDPARTDESEFDNQFANGAFTVTDDAAPEHHDKPFQIDFGGGRTMDVPPEHADTVMQALDRKGVKFNARSIDAIPDRSGGPALGAGGTRGSGQKPPALTAPPARDDSGDQTEFDKVYGSAPNSGATSPAIAEPPKKPERSFLERFVHPDMPDASGALKSLGDTVSGINHGITGGLDTLLPFGVGDAIKKDREASDPRFETAGQVVGTLANPIARAGGSGAALTGKLGSITSNAVRQGLVAGAIGTENRYADQEDGHRDLLKALVDSAGDAKTGFVLGGATHVAGELAGGASNLVKRGADWARGKAYGVNAADVGKTVDQMGTVPGLAYAKDELRTLPEKLGLTKWWKPQSAEDYAKGASQLREEGGALKGSALDRADAVYANKYPPSAGTDLPAGGAPGSTLDAVRGTAPLSGNLDAIRDAFRRESGGDELPASWEHLAASEGRGAPSPVHAADMSPVTPLDHAKDDILERLVAGRAADRAAFSGSGTAGPYEDLTNRMQNRVLERPSQLDAAKREYEANSYAKGPGTMEAGVGAANKVAADETRNRLGGIISGANRADPGIAQDFTRGSQQYGEAKTVEDIASRAAAHGYVAPLVGAAAGGYAGLREGHDWQDGLAGAALGAGAMRLGQTYGADVGATVGRGVQHTLGAVGTGLKAVAQNAGGLEAAKDASMGGRGHELPGVVKQLLVSNPDALGKYRAQFEQAGRSPAGIAMLLIKLNAKDPEWNAGIGAQLQRMTGDNQ